MSGFEVEPASLRAAADAIDATTDASTARTLSLDAPFDLGHRDLEVAAAGFTTGWNGAARGLVTSSDELAAGLRASAAWYAVTDTVGGALLSVRRFFGVDR